jgi:hypothetical protein
MRRRERLASPYAAFSRLPRGCEPLLAGAVVQHARTGAARDALVAVRLTVATAHRRVLLGADFRARLACTLSVCLAADRDALELAELIRAARVTRASTACNGRALAERADTGASRRGHALVAVRVTIAAADRRVFAGADLWHRFTRARLIGRAAHRVESVCAVLACVALQTEQSAAALRLATAARAADLERVVRS